MLSPIFRLLELTLHGWDFWPPFQIPLDRDLVLLTGPDGSGKTSLLDAVRQLLNTPRLSSNRRIQSYLRRPDAPALICAVVSNEAPKGSGARPPFHRERIREREATLACALVPNGGGSPEKRYAVLPGRPPVEEVRRYLVESRDAYEPGRYQRALEHAGFTRGMRSALTLEQGRTESLFELTPRELFRRRLETLGDPAVLERYQEARRRSAGTAAEEARAALAERRLRLLETVSGALQDFQQRAKGLAETAEITFELGLPLLDGGDRSLDEAEIRTRFGFDGKKPVPLGDPSFSSGQKAVAGLILLLALAETGPAGETAGRGGLFLLDEPFAHLSPDRIHQVLRLLDAARAQLLVTAPAVPPPLDRAGLDRAPRVIALQKKPPEAPHAPAPFVTET